MGGYGSGPGPARYLTVEGCHSLDIRKLKRDGCLRPGSLVSSSWVNSRTGVTEASISAFIHRDKVVLSYRHSRPGEEWQHVEEPIRLTWTRCNYGGLPRPWFICPGALYGFACSRRVAILYNAGRYFLCRRCYQLAYISQRRGLADRLMEKARRIRIRLGGSASLLEPFPWKPKGMHWRTYWRLRAESEQADLESWYANPFTRRLLCGIG